LSEIIRDKDESQYLRHYDEDEDEIDLVELFITIKNGWKIIVVVMLLTFSSTIYYLASTPNIFRADATIMPLKGRSNIKMEMLQKFGGMDFLKDIVQASMPTVFTSPTTSKIRSLALSKNFLIYIIEKYQLLPLLFSEAYNSTTNKWKIKKSCKEIKINEFTKITGISLFKESCHPTITQGYEKLLSMISIGKSEYFKHDNNLIQISIDSPNPHFAQMLLVKLLKEIDNKLRQEAIKRATDNQNYATTIMAKTSDKKIKTHLKTFIYLQIEQVIYAQTNASFLFDIVNPPIVPDKPIAPKRKLVLTVSLVTGLILGIFIVFFLSFIHDSRINTISEK